MKKLVNVEFLYEGIVDENDFERGVLFNGDKVLVSSRKGVGLYNAHPSQVDDPGAVLVDLDQDGYNFIHYFPEMLLDLVCA